MIHKRQVWRDYNWTILTFPKRNKTILWNDDLKKYDIYNGLPEKDKDKIRLRGLEETKKIRDTDLRHWRAMCWILSGALGITLALLIFLMLLK